ncbi:50S ribosomal protein L4 [Candidatus Woesearchaeota archaeon]|nr:50S ribosomal protein L4 [Candidatus Woesearchaeota archaeon]
MMKLPIIGADNSKSGFADLPAQFSEVVDSGLIRRAVLAIQANRRQPYGASPGAGKRQSAKLSRRRRNYKGSYGMGISRVPRKTMSRRGRRFVWQGAFAPGTVGGRRAHPPKAEKVWAVKINRKENRKAIRSALAATLSRDLVTARGHMPPDTYPFVLAGQFEDISRTKDVHKALLALGFSGELERAHERSIRAGKGRMRGRKYVRKTGPLLVVSKKCSLMKSARNLGVDIVEVSRLNAELLAPGASPGRMAVFTDGAMARIGREGLFG